MPKGKAGPKPPDPKSDDRSAEEIVGKENIVDVGEALKLECVCGEFSTRSISALHDHVSAATDGREHALNTGTQTAPRLVELPPVMNCKDCTFKSNLLAEMEEHLNGAMHSGYFHTEEKSEIVPVQPELFSTPGIIHRQIEVPLEEDFLANKRVSLAELYQQALDVKAKKKAHDDRLNAQLKEIDEQMQEIARVLATPYTLETVDCEWRVIEGENARGLYRLDNDALIETLPLTGEDRESEMEKAAEDNAPAEREVPAEDQEIVETEVLF